MGLSCLGAATLRPGTAVAEMQWNLGPADALLGRPLDNLHFLVMIIIGVIFVGVFGFMFYAILRHRKSMGHEAAHFHENTTVEIIWTVVPLLIIIGMAWPATRTLLQIRDAAVPAITIKVTRYQMKWGFEYLDEGVNFNSSLAPPRQKIKGGGENGENNLLKVDEPMVVPVGRHVRVLITSNDVPHSSYIPESTAKGDGNPDVIRDAWFRADTTGTFRIRCAGSCGSDDEFSSIVVKVVSDDDYESWLALQKVSSGADPFDPTKAYRVAALEATGAADCREHCGERQRANGKGMLPSVCRLSVVEEFHPFRLAA